MICPDRAKAAELARLLGEYGLGMVPHHGYPTGSALLALLHNPPPALCLVDADAEPETALRLIAEINGRSPNLPIVALLGASNPDLILRCLRVGASEFLVRPFTGEQWEAVWGRIARAGHERPQDGQAGKIVCLVPGKGASGATTIAVNLAFQLKRAGREKLLLADLDGLMGTVGFQLKLKSSYNFLDALTHSDRLDPDLWKVVVSQIRGVDVLLAPDDPAGMDQDWNPAPLVEFCRYQYELAVLDCGSGFGDWNLAVVRMADEVLLVTTADLPALHATQRVLAWWEEQGVSRNRLRVVLNRYSEERDLAVDAIEAALQCPVFHTLPADPETLQKAVMEGKPAPASSRFARGLSALAEKLCGRPQAERGGSLLSFLFRGR
ncbi:MAG: AAA family ATPase [Bryobacteraceae bacterium]